MLLLFTMTLFEKIMHGDVPCHKLYEDSQVFAFLDILPLARGHTLVIPREPAATMAQLSEESAAALGRVLPRLTRVLQETLGTSAFNILQNNTSLAYQSVPHVHFHIIPKFEAATGLRLVWEPGVLIPEEAEELSSKVRKRFSPSPEAQR
jgi:histidine triad (HIT) family protein